MLPIILCAVVALAILSYMLASARPSSKYSRVRRYPRLEIALRVHIHDGHNTHAVEARNISQGGMALHGRAPVAVAQPVQVSFTLPEEVAVTIPAVITHKRGEQIGLRFDPTHQRRLVIEKWIKQELAERTAAQESSK